MTSIERELKIFGSRTKYWIYNEGAPQKIVAVHGFRGNHSGLKYILAGLDEFEIVVPDLPGFGESLPMTERAHNIAGYSDFVVDFTTKMNLSGSTLLGHSFGTIVAAHVASHHAELFTRLILINPISISPGKGIISKPATKLVEAYYWLGLHLPETTGQRVLKSRAYNRLMSLTLIRTGDPATKKLVYSHHLGDLEQPHHHQAIGEAFAASITKTALDDAAHITLPTLIIAGEQDPIVPLPAQRKLHAGIAKSQLIVVPKVGHLIHLETPAAAATAISQFLNAA